jgi:hypothetical protein
MSEPHRAGWPPLRTAFWVLLTLAAVAIFGAKFLGYFRPSSRAIVDFSQEWLSAKNYWAGLPVYSDQKESLRQHLNLNVDATEVRIRYSAHPPVAVLPALPLAGLGYEDAMLAWNLATFALFLVAVALVVRELRVPFCGLSLLPATVILLAAYPVAHQLVQGQLNFLLAFLLVLGWVADRRDRQVPAGVAVGVAAAIKLIPLFLLVYFVAARRWRAVIGLAVAFVGLNLAAAGLFGLDAFRFYVAQVLPQVSEEFASYHANASISGFWARLFAPRPEVRLIPLADAPWLATLITNLLRGVVVAVAGWVAWRADSVEGRDKAFAVATVAMLLVSPLTWAHYFVLLLLPLGLVWMRTPGVWPRVFMWVVFLVLMLPDRIGTILVMGVQGADRFRWTEDRVLTPCEGLAMIPLPHYALVGLFLLTVLAPKARPPGGGPRAVEPGAGGT